MTPSMSSTGFRLGNVMVTGCSHNIHTTYGYYDWF